MADKRGVVTLRSVWISRMAAPDGKRGVKVMLFPARSMP